MKSYCLIVGIFLVFVASGAFAAIRNGYEKNILGFRHSLKSLHEILQNDSTLSTHEKTKLRDKMNQLMDYITYYEITENLLRQFRIVSPELYNEIDTIRDARGRPTDVYVKFTPKQAASIQAAGATFLGQVADDNDTYSSEYGEGTVSVRIWLVNNALWVLSHEFGHVRYQVPNLASYIKFYKSNYSTRLFNPNNVGHDRHDPSGKSAMVFVKRFIENYSAYVKSGNKLASPLLLIGDIRKRIHGETLASNAFGSL